MSNDTTKEVLKETPKEEAQVPNHPEAPKEPVVAPTEAPKEPVVASTEVPKEPEPPSLSVVLPNKETPNETEPPKETKEAPKLPVVLPKEETPKETPKEPEPPKEVLEGYSFDKSKWKKGTGKDRVVLVSCGSFSPITIMHLRLMEMSKDQFIEAGYDVVGGYFSPVGDGYKKAGLENGAQRVAMLHLAVQSSDWIMIDTWESLRPNWTPTRLVLDHLDEEVNRGNEGKKIRVAFVCGSDLLDSFNKPGVWDPEDIKAICQNHGIVVLSREGADTDNIIWSNDLLYSLRTYIQPVHQWIPNDISSTRVRRALARGLSVKYLVPDTVLEYIHANKLYISK